jgi:ABC-2 type transport system permease protein
MNARRLRMLIVREIRATLRDPFTASILVLVPLVTLLLFNSILTTDVRHVRLGVHDAENSPASRRLVAELSAQGTFDPVRLATRADLDEALRRGRVRAAIVIPPDFDRALALAGRGGRPPEIQAWYDGGEALLAANVEGYLRAIVERAGATLVDGPGPNGGAGVAVSTRVLFNPTLDGKVFMVAGVYGFVFSFLTVLITAVSVVGERLAGTFDQLQVTPATSVEILLGKLLPLGGVFAFDVLLMALVAGAGLGVWPRGSLVFFLGVSTFYVLVSLAIGLLISATSSTASEAVQRSVLFSIPLVQLSGFMFPIRSMPGAVQWFVELFPATHYIRVSRAIYMRAAGPGDLWGDLVFIACAGVLLFALTVRSLGART